MITTKAFTKKMYFFITCIMMTLSVHYVPASQQRGAKRTRDVFSQSRVNEQEEKYREKVREAWKKCRLPNLPKINIVGDELEPGFKKTVKCEGEKLLPPDLVRMILNYCAYYDLHATAQRWDLTQLKRLLNVSFDYPFGLVSCSKGHLRISSSYNNNTYNTFNISLIGEDDVTVSNGPLTPIGEYHHVRCNTGVLTRQNSNTELVSLKDGRTLAPCQKLKGNSVQRLYAQSREWMVVEFDYPAKGVIPVSGMFITNHITKTAIALKKDSMFGKPHVVLCQPKHAKSPWVLVFYSTISARKSQPVLDIFESINGTRLASVKNPGKFLYAHDDHQSIVCIDDPRHISHTTSVVSHYALPTGALTTQTVIKPFADIDPESRTRMIFNAKVLQAQIWDDVIVGIHPRYGTSLILTDRDLTRDYLVNFDIQQDIADKDGNYLAAVVKDKFSEEQRLIVWNITAQ